MAAGRQVVDRVVEEPVAAAVGWWVEMLAAAVEETQEAAAMARVEQGRVAVVVRV